jgi:hypothetical protein
MSQSEADRHKGDRVEQRRIVVTGSTWSGPESCIMAVCCRASF